MKSTSVSATIIAMAIVLAAGAVCAQPSPSREQVKSDTRAAERAGKLTPAGEGPVVGPPSTRSTKTRAERKAETLAARKAGELEPAGPAAGLKQQRSEVSRPSTVTTSDRKAATRAAEKAGTLTRAGEGPGAPVR